MMIANRVANESGQLPVLADEIANDTMIGIETCIFFGQIRPAPRLLEMHRFAVGRKPLHQHRHPAIMKDPGQIRLIGKNVADRHPLVGYQHRQFGDRQRTRPVSLESLAIVLGRQGGGHGDGAQDIRGLLQANRLKYAGQRRERLKPPECGTLYDLEQRCRNTGVLGDDVRQGSHISHAAC